MLWATYANDVLGEDQQASQGLGMCSVQAAQGEVQSHFSVYELRPGRGGLSSADGSPAPSSVRRARAARPSSTHQHGDDDLHFALTKQDADTTPKSQEPIDIWQSIKRVALIKDDEGDSDSDGSSFEHVDQSVKEAALANDHLLFGAPNPSFNLAACHPNHRHIFRLWQIYLDNVNPLLKVTHTPTLQPMIIEAIGDMESISPSMEALMFSIYCVAVLSLDDDECHAAFQTPRETLLGSYQVACKQALLKCSPWRSNNRDALTALLLYLVSLGNQVEPRSLSCMLTVAVHIAKRMGMPYESSSGAPDGDALGHEMNRRLWWCLVMFEHRLCEITGQDKSTSLTPNWNCHVPLNLNDFEMQAGVKTPPAPNENVATEAMFVVVRSELADFVRRSVSHLEVIGGSPSPDAVARTKRKGGELQVLETMLEDRHLKLCNMEIPLHFMTVWATRSTIARSRLTEYYLKWLGPASESPTSEQHSIADGWAIRMLESDTQIRTSPLTKGFLWLAEAGYSPVLTYFHVLHSLIKRPGDELADELWGALCDNYEALMDGPKHHRTRIMFALKFTRLTLQAWHAREAHSKGKNSPSGPPPRLVVDAQARDAQASLGRGRSSAAQRTSPGGQSSGLTPNFGITPGSSTGMSSLFPSPTDMGTGQLYGSSGSSFGFPASAGLMMDMPGQGCAGINMDQFWTGEGFKWI
ncbi:uncharacterized protein E0L32_008905 [Thyridium curvatum]|uniref:Xylanolytic transcriptional activator regulatory domain-containing protein n=1 Tax=Thyridium curvatum TaxID=1093900 RepID=A0A507AQ37_9PEZI|nr:uncharacterized protein E0L32_008905 [Thyridium curvatum]TPX09883.1 hypothetical protein E0L32_008905 [Thyridium curvatum]